MTPLSRLTLKKERNGGCAKAGAKYSGTAQSAVHRSWSILNEGANGGIARVGVQSEFN